MVPFVIPMQIASDAPATFRSSARRPGSLELLTTAVAAVSGLWEGVTPCVAIVTYLRAGHAVAGGRGLLG